MGWLRFLVAERFRNIEEVKKCRGPTLIVHGQLDDVIRYHHGLELYEASTGEPKRLINPQHMDHNTFNLVTDILRPIAEFMRESGIDVEPNESHYCVSFKSDVSK